MENIPQEQGMQQASSDQDAVEKIVLAGMKLMYDPATRQVFEQGVTAKLPISDVLAREAVGVLKMIDERAKGNLPRHLIAPVATMLLAEIAKFMKDAGIADPSEQDLLDGVKKMLGMVMKVFGKELLAKRRGQAQQPAASQAQPTQPAPQMPAQQPPAGLIQSGV